MPSCCAGKLATTSILFECLAVTLASNQEFLCTLLILTYMKLKVFNTTQRSKHRKQNCYTDIIQTPNKLVYNLYQFITTDLLQRKHKMIIEFYSKVNFINLWCRSYAWLHKEKRKREKSVPPVTEVSHITYICLETDHKVFGNNGNKHLPCAKDWGENFKI